MKGMNLYEITERASNGALTEFYVVASGLTSVGHVAAEAAKQTVIVIRALGPVRLIQEEGEDR
jgi:hypothetical protein